LVLTYKIKNIMAPTAGFYSWCQIWKLVRDCGMQYHFIMIT